MGQFESSGSPNALLAFGRRVSPGDAFDDLVDGRGWQVEAWHPTFVESPDPQAGLPPPHLRTALDTWNQRQVLRPPERLPPQAADPGAPRLMVASAAEMPTLYFVEWHYIDFVLSCTGNVSEAARVLGIRRSTLQRKRKKNPPER